MKTFLANMMHFSAILTGLLLLVWGCTKYKDPAPQNLNLTNKYCNLPNAINYNWGFPGTPDNTVCIFPTDEVTGSFTFYDSLLDATGILLPYDTFDVLITKINDTSININGWCNNTKSITAKVKRNLRFSLDSNTDLGSLLCANTDTISGSGIKNNIGDSIINFSYKLHTSTNLQIHKGVFIKK